MTRKIVGAVFFARYTSSNFRAIYGRLPTNQEATYTKDFLQVLQATGAVLAEVLPASQTAPTDIVYEWPTGNCSGKFEWTNSRWHMKWLTNHKPIPWTIGNTATSEISIPGDPTLRDPSLADAEYQAIQTSGTEPWLVAIKLVGESCKLHVRTYFRNPTHQFSNRGISQLPVPVQNAIDSLPPNDGSGALRLPNVTTISSEPKAKRITQAVLEALVTEPNILLIGPPGTGKSVALEDLRAHYENLNPTGAILFDTSLWGGEWTVAGTEARSEVLVFHPSYSYENFVAGLFPKTSQNGGIELEAKPGPLLNLAHWIGQSDRQAMLILDEFNRGQAAAIFGDMLSLLDKDKRSAPTILGSHIQRPYPTQVMPVPPDYNQVTGQLEEVAQNVKLPASLHIVAAMNSTDRSVAPLDAAMRRRFTVIRVGPDYETLESHLGLDAQRAGQPLPTTNDISHWTNEDISVLAVLVLKKLNERIEFCLGED